MKNFELALLFVICPVGMLFYCGFPNMDNTSASQFVTTVNILSTLPSMLLVPVMGNEMCQHRLVPFMFDMQSQQWRKNVFLVHWVLTDFSLLAMSTAIGVLAALGIGYAQFLDAAGIASVALISIAYACVLACVQFAVFTIVTAITLPKPGEEIIWPGSLLALGFAATGTLFNGFVYPSQNVFYQVLGYLCPGYWLGNSNLITALQGMDMCAGGAGCVPMDTILMHLNDRAVSDVLPGFALVYSSGSMFFLILASAVAFKHRRFYALHLFMHYTQRVSDTDMRCSAHGQAAEPLNAIVPSYTSGDADAEAEDDIIWV